MSLKFEKESGILKILMPEEPEIKDFESLISIYNEQKPVDLVKLDLKNCFYIQSKHLAQLIGFKKLLTKDNAKIVLVNVKESVLQVLEITNLLSQFAIEKDYSSYSPDELLELFFDPEVADEVSDFIASNYNDDYKAKLFEALKVDDPVLLEYVIVTLGKVHEYELEEVIPKFMDFEVANVQKAAILVAGWLGIFDVKEKIYKYLESEFIDVAEAAAASIALLSDESDADRVKKYLASPDERLRKIAAQSLALINDDISFKYLSDAIKSEENNAVKAFMLKCLSFFNKIEVADMLIEYLKDDSEIVRESAAASLTRIKATDKVDKIIEYANDSDEMVSFFAIKALGNICKSNKCIDKLMHIYNGASTRVKAAILEALGKIGNAEIGDFLYQALSEENEDLRKEALNSLSIVNKDLAIQSAKEIILNDDSWVVRFKAVEILQDLPIQETEDIFKKVLAKESNRYVKEKLSSLVGEL